MLSVAKNLLSKAGNRLNSGVIEAVRRSSEENAAKLNSVYKEIHNTQLNINHHQLEICQELDKRVRNSGCMQISPTESVTKIFSGAKMYVDPRDIAVVPHLVLDSIWEHRITSAWLSVIQPNDTVVDIGANFGYFGVLAAQRTNKKSSKVVFFEANPYLIPYLRKTLDVNWFNEQSVIENLAIAESEKKVTLNILKDYIGSSSLQSLEQLDAYMHGKMDLEIQESVSVQATTLDSYCKNKKIKSVDLIKMDIEGYEEKAYEGMREIIKKSPSATLFVEFTREGYEDPKGFYAKMLNDFGHVYIIDEDGYIVAPKQNDYDSVIGNPDDWVMPIFSKKDNLANKVTV